MPAPFKIHELLSRAELDDLEQFARKPGRSVDECHAWMLERQFNVSRASVGRWKQEFDRLLLHQRFSGSAELARVIKDSVKGGEFGDIADAALMQLTQVVFEQAASLQADGQIDPLDVQRWTRSLRNVIGSKAGLMKVAADKFDREMSRRAAKGTITQQDIEEARRIIFGS